MTDKQFERFTNIIKAINKLSEKRKNIFDNQNMIITITDSKRFYIQIRMKFYKGKYNEQYIKDLIISKLKDIEKENKKLDFDNECGLDIVFEKKNNKKARA